MLWKMSLDRRDAYVKMVGLYGNISIWGMIQERGCCHYRLLCWESLGTNRKEDSSRRNFFWRTIFVKVFLFICLFFKSPWGLSAINGISIREAFLWQQITEYICNPSALGIVYYFDSDYFYLKHICICCATIYISEIHKSKKYRLENCISL